VPIECGAARILPIAATPCRKMLPIYHRCCMYSLTLLATLDRAQVVSITTPPGRGSRPFTWPVLASMVTNRPPLGIVYSGRASATEWAGGWVTRKVRSTNDEVRSVWLGVLLLALCMTRRTSSFVLRTFTPLVTCLWPAGNGERGRARAVRRRSGCGRPARAWPCQCASHRGAGRRGAHGRNRSRSRRQCRSGSS
jgi:hypothetical protein